MPVLVVLLVVVPLVELYVLIQVGQVIGTLPTVLLLLLLKRPHLHGASQTHRSQPRPASTPTSLLRRMEKSRSALPASRSQQSRSRC